MTPPDSRASAGPTTPGPLATARKYSKIFRASLVERMTYRGDFLLGTVLRFLPLVTTVLLWQAIYQGSGESRLNGFSYHDTIAYLLLTNISRMFSSMPGLAGGIARDIRDGTLKRYLVQPLDLIGFLFSYRVAHKATYIVTSFIPYAVLFGVFISHGYFEARPDLPTLGAYMLALAVAFLVGFFFETCVGMVGFWFLEVTSVLYIVMTLNFFISGHMLPLDLLPYPWGDLLKWLPFQYMAYFPAVVLLGKVKGWALATQLLLGLFWALFFMALARGLYRHGLKRYSAYGG